MEVDNDDVATTVTITGDSAPLVPSFQNRSNTMIVGPTQSGKTHLLQEILKNGTKYLAPSGVSDAPKEGYLNRIYVLTDKQSAESWEILDTPYEKEVISELNDIKKKLSEGSFISGSLVVIDDMISRFRDKQFVNALTHHVSVSTHHNDLWTFLITQDFFAGDSKIWRRNAQNIIMFRNGKRAVTDLLQNVVPKEDIPKITVLYNEATSENFRPLIIMQYKPKTQTFFYAGLNGIFMRGEKTGSGITMSPITL